MIEIQHLSKRFGNLQAVDDLNLTVLPGEVLGFLGPNGAGKSTTMKMVTGFLQPDAGRILVMGHDLAKDPIAAKACMGYLPEGAPLYPDMTPTSLLRFVAAARNIPSAQRASAIDRAIGLLELEAVRDQRIETLSKGFKRRVGLAQAILHDPDVLILDEPTDGLDPNQKHVVREMIRRMAENKVIVLSTHLLEEVPAVCSRV
ncbi:MAG: ABC transporter ATP-binding protein, partial [Planctomycetes bacterium]|nr:ABC transporter ATP-binding protein [Planctomycetota bacterium]